MLVYSHHILAYVPLSPYLSVSNADVYVYTLSTIVTLLLFLIVMVVCHWSKTHFKSKVELQDVCPADENLEISGLTFPAGLDIDYSNIVFRREVGEGNFGKVYQGYLQINGVQR